MAWQTVGSLDGKRILICEVGRQKGDLVKVTIIS